MLVMEGITIQILRNNLFNPSLHILNSHQEF